MPYVTDALKVLLDYSSKLSDNDEEKGATEINFIQQTINQLNNSYASSMQETKNDY